METTVADVRELPFPDGHVDQVLLVSTLEHVGADNERYGVGADRDRFGIGTALRELRRVLRPDGSLLVTVPARRARGLRLVPAGGRARLDAPSSSAPASSSRSWRSTSSARRAGAPRRRLTRSGVRYGERGPAASAVLCAELSPRRLSRLTSVDGLRRTARRRGAPVWRRLRPPPSSS